MEDLDRIDEQNEQKKSINKKQPLKGVVAILCIAKFLLYKLKSPILIEPINIYPKTGTSVISIFPVLITSIKKSNPLPNISDINSPPFFIIGITIKIHLFANIITSVKTFVNSDNAFIICYTQIIIQTTH